MPKHHLVDSTHHFLSKLDRLLKSPIRSIQLFRHYMTMLPPQPFFEV
jgi:hypothetical protein